MHRTFPSHRCHPGLEPGSILMGMERRDLRMGPGSGPGRQGENAWALPGGRSPRRVIPAQAGIHVRMLPRAWKSRLAFSMDSGLRRNDIGGGAGSAGEPYSPQDSAKISLRRYSLSGVVETTSSIFQPPSSRTSS